ncbi:MAG: DUF4342 domain-containing protein [Eubacteriales bacterium]|nr:DUF4342 domain-containing protein [Eubacteriales bacterium]
MDNFEMTEKLREKADVSYEEAKAALEASDWDLLDAILLLESKGKVKKHKHIYDNKEETEQENKINHEERAGVNISLQSIIDFLAKLINKGSRNYLEVSRNGKKLFSLPIILLVIFILLFAISIPLFIISLFLGCRYRFVGEDIGSKANSVMDKVQDTAENIKETVKEKMDENK